MAWMTIQAKKLLSFGWFHKVGVLHMEFALLQLHYYVVNHFVINEDVISLIKCKMQVASSHSQIKAMHMEYLMSVIVK